ncbi:hypothetical protein ACLOJK_000055 [Asimina triloba]
MKRGEKKNPAFPALNYTMSRFRALWQASLNATKKALTWNVEDLMPLSEKLVFNFNSKEELKRWHLYSDSEYGGLSSASLEIKDGNSGLSGTNANFLQIIKMPLAFMHYVVPALEIFIPSSGWCSSRLLRDNDDTKKELI